MRKARYILWIVVIAGLALTACGKQAPTPTPGSTRPQPGAPGGLGELNSLVLGTLKLEETADAVTPEQAAALLLLWQMIQSGTLQGAAETQAVIRQIEGVMTDSQIAAIEAMGLTFEDVQAWMQEQGIEMPAPPAGGGGFGAFQNPWATPPGRSLSEEERSRLRQEFQNMSHAHGRDGHPATGGHRRRRRRRAARRLWRAVQRAVHRADRPACRASGSVARG